MKDDAKLKQFKVSLNPEIVKAFKDACSKSGISMASVISQLMADYSKMLVRRNDNAPDYSTRRRRRAAIGKMMKQMERVRDFEQEYCDRIPENLRTSIVYDRAEELVSLLDEVIELMASV